MSHVLDELGRIKIALGSGSSGWPFANIITVSATDPNADFTTITAALAVATAGTIILIDGGTYVETLTIGVACTLIGMGENQTIITSSSATTITCSVSGVTLRGLTVANTSTAVISTCIEANDTLIDSCIIRKVSGAAPASIGIQVGAGSGYTVIRDCDVLVTAGSLGYGVVVSHSAQTTIIENGRISGLTNDALIDTLTIFIDPVLVNSSVAGVGGSRGQYYTTAGNLITLDTTGLSSGVWLIDESATLKIKESTLAAAIAAAASGDTIKLDTDTYSIAAMQNIGVSVTVEGDGPEATIITNSVNNSACFDITAAVTVIFRNLTIKMTGSGAAITGIFSNDAAAVILDNCVIDISSGSPTDTRGLWIETGTWTLRNGSKIICTVGTSRYGIYNDAGPVTIAIGAGCEVNGATFDIYSDQSSSVLTANSAILTNNTVSWAGIFNQEPEDKIVKNLLYSGMNHNLWLEGTTLNDLADDTYGPDTVWNVLNKSNAPDISGQAGGSTDPFTESFRCTFDANNEQAGIVQFLLAEDTYPLRGQVVSLSADLWGTNVITLRMAVIVWTSTADAITSDVVGTWATGNPTLATNWAYIGTPAAISITSTRTRYAVNNLAVPTNANNIAMFIWTDASESSGDFWEVARTQMERGPIATRFVSRNRTDEKILINQLYQKSYNDAAAPGTNTLVGGVQVQPANAIAGSVAGTIRRGADWSPNMWGNPTIVLYSTDGTANAVRNRTAVNNRTGCTASTSSQRGFLEVAVDNTSTNAIAVNDIITFHYTADKRL